MLQELAGATGNTVAVVVVMLLAIGLFGLVVWGLAKMGGAEAAKRARLPLEDAPAAEPGVREAAEPGAREAAATGDEERADE